MSGPKTSRYKLTEKQRRMLEEQRKIEQRKAVASENIKRDSEQLFQLSNRFDAEKRVAEELIKRTGKDNGFNCLIEKLDDLILQTQQLISHTDSKDVISVESTAASIKESLSSAEAITKELSGVALDNENELQEDLNAAIDLGFEYSFSNISVPTQSKVQSSTLVADTKRKLYDMCKDVTLPEALLNKVKEAQNKLAEIEDESYAKNYIAVSVNPLLRSVDQYLAVYNCCHMEFDTLHAEYTALCELYHYVAKEYECSEDSIIELKDEISRIRNVAAEDDEQSYISGCLDEVMSEMGYSVIGHRDVRKKSGKHFHNELYTYGDSTAINVTYSSDGQITMELGGLDDKDRTPSPIEASALCGSMADFCEDFKEIEERLLAKGVVVANRISLLPPEADYAQIINTSDYNMNAQVESMHVKKRSQVKKQHNAMRQE